MSDFNYLKTFKLNTVNTTKFIDQEAFELLNKNQKLANVFHGITKIAEVFDNISEGEGITETIKKIIRLYKNKKY